MDVFKKALEFTLKWEGAYVNNPADRGGATNQGITQKTYDIYRRKRNLVPQGVRHLSDSERDWIYRTSYFDAIDGTNKPPKLAIACFDFAVNSGPKRALDYYVDDLDEYLTRRKNFFLKIAHGNQYQFLKGWLNRLNSLQKYLNDLA